VRHAGLSGHDDVMSDPILLLAGRRFNAEALTFRQIGTSLAQSAQTRKRVSGESAQLLPVLQVKSGAEGGDRTRTGLRPQDFKFSSPYPHRSS